MLRKLRFALLAFGVVSTMLGAQPATAGPAGCPPTLCVVIDGRVVDPHGNPAPDYEVVAQRADGYNETIKTNDEGAFTFTLPPTTSSNCYQIVGRSDPFYTVSSISKKACTSQKATLRPQYRLQGASGQQKTYLGDPSAHRYIDVDVYALSRSFPAPFANDRLPYVFEYHTPTADMPPHEQHDHDFPDMHGEHGHHERWTDTAHPNTNGFFAKPAVRKIADGVWQYIWKQTVHLPSHEPGFYSMDWGRGGSVFSPMMDCRMVWLGYGTATLSPAKALPGTTVTITGQRLGNDGGIAVIKGGGQVTTLSGPSILSWSDSKVTFMVPPGAKSGWVTLVPDGRIPTNAQPLTVGP